MATEDTPSLNSKLLGTWRHIGVWLVSGFAEPERPRAMALILSFLLVGSGALLDALLSANQDPLPRTLLTCGVALVAWSGIPVFRFTRSFGGALHPIGFVLTANFLVQYLFSGQVYFLAYLLGIPVGIALLGGSRRGASKMCWASHLTNSWGPIC